MKFTTTASIRRGSYASARKIAGMQSFPVHFVAVAVAVIALPLFGALRPLSVSAPDENGKIVVSIGGIGMGSQQLIAAWANCDRGPDPLDWTEYADAGTVVAADTEKVFEIPMAWMKKSGAIRFFLMSGVPPYLIRYDYITRPDCTDGELIIETGIVPDKTIDISVKSQSYSFSSMVPWGSTDVCIFTNGGSDNNDRYFFSFLGVVHPGIDNPSVTALTKNDKNVFGEKPPKSTDPHVIRMCREGIYIDGYRHLGPFDDSELTSNPTLTLALFGRRGNWKQQGTTCSIFSASIVTNGVPAREYVPCKSPDGLIQMYDRVTHSFSGIKRWDNSKKTFQPGNDIGPYPADCGEVDSVSAMIGVGPEIAIADIDAGNRTVSVSLSRGHDEGLLFATAGASDAGLLYSLWTTNILVSKVGIGTNSVTAVLPREWWRNKYNVRFAWRSLAGRPYDYDVSYIHADGDGGCANFCRTGWKPTTNTSIHVNAKTALDTAPFGVAGYFMLFLNNKSNSKFFYAYGDKNNNGLDCDNWSTFANDYHYWRLGPTEARVDNLVVGSYSGAAPSDDVTANICLPFRAHSKNDHWSVSKTGNVEVASAKIWEGDVIVRDFAPCVNEGVPGFYDNVRCSFYPSDTAKPFVAGNIVADDGDFVAWSPVCRLENGFVLIIW